MASSAKSISPPRSIKLSQIALPTEHGSWGFLFEPILGSLFIAFSFPGLWIALMVIGAFLTRRPLQVLIGQLKAGSGEMKTVALKFAAAFLLTAVIGLTGTIVTSDLSVLIPLVLALPLAAFQIYTETTKRGRQLGAELLGAMVMPTSAASIVVADGGTWTFAASVWFFFVARFVPSIIYVRNRLNLEKGKDGSMLLPAISHIIALMAIGSLAVVGYLPRLAIPAFALLLARSIYGLSPYRKRVKAMKIGVWEVVYGLVTVASLIAGHYLPL